MRIRPLTEEDRPVIRAWMRDTPRAPIWGEADFGGLVTIPSAEERKLRKAWAADEVESGIAGFAVATALCIPGTPAECELEFVLVSPQARRQGIGRILVQTAIAWARELGAQEIWLEVRESNAGALRLYERCGFVVAGRRPQYYPGHYADPPEDAVLMRCRISYVPEDAPV
jgi:ribosomal protein S18 acetylase RimI-like enzyme